MSSNVCSAVGEGCSRSSLDIKGEFPSCSLYAPGLTFVDETGDCGCQEHIGVFRGARRFLVRSDAIAGDVGRRQEIDSAGFKGVEATSGEAYSLWYQLIYLNDLLL